MKLDLQTEVLETEAEVSRAIIGTAPGSRLKIHLSDPLDHHALEGHGCQIVELDGSQAVVELNMDFFLPGNLDWFTENIQPKVVEIESTR
ncbi:hypothetical protein C4566_01355 [Candidatus Parcubacteria bacterium]|nr:MAG: hypothetical protein C4566_01355 [Candidatus Parcubacteria bacterium]